MRHSRAPIRYELRALAEVLQALAGKLSEAQAAQALDPVLKQMGQTTDPDALQALALAPPGFGAEADRGAGGTSFKRRWGVAGVGRQR